MAKKKDATAGTPATTLLTRERVTFTVHTYEAEDRSRASSSSDRVAFGTEAASALGVDEARVFKTLVAEVDGSMWVAVVPVGGLLDLKALAAAAGGKKAVMADPAAAERSSGYVVGGISPLGQRRALPTVVDASALEHATVYVSGGRRGLDLELAPADLVRLTRARTAPIGRGPE
ncbi:Cys-tRNA(Pro) deacylase [Kineosporia succinea]|uniref:Cys-tRNA(Pro)/Cys-tRNA(Cys) deacylase n=1 Tax=Kineosporia succinea TaxID=84632 RepID=A0ABT9P7D3_9ACTN|nr:Cys-tRNA(Pro) deacylase [Kineosporia succinea]MDP9828314.1 Cys-tRNA(Pro)/Cys-tRNA(Cys) deacylase [Kineosporia succinea]